MAVRKKRLRDRPTAEVVILILAFTVAGTIFLDIIFLILLAIFEPEKNLGEFARNVGDIVNVLIGALVGYLAGSRGKLPASEKENPQA